jgi:hypothetical protein
MTDGGALGRVILSAHGIRIEIKRDGWVTVDDTKQSGVEVAVKVSALTDVDGSQCPGEYLVRCSETEKMRYLHDASLYQAYSAALEMAVSSYASALFGDRLLEMFYKEGES